VKDVFLRDYTYHEATVCLCPVCSKRLSGKILLKDGKAYLYRYCNNCGGQLDLLEENLEYWLLRREYDKPGNKIIPQTDSLNGCPFDCGLCPEHEQHSCMGLIEITDACNLNCPVCYAKSKENGAFLPVDEVIDLARCFIEQEGGKVDVIQVSGGEPSIHPQIIEILKELKKLPIDYLMLNTNGLRFAEDKIFADAISDIAMDGGFEVYLQFDGMSDKVYKHFRGRKLLGKKLQVIEILQERKIPATLVMTVDKGVNDNEIADVIKFALNNPIIRGVNIQPICFSGRVSDINRLDRPTLSGIVDYIYRNFPEEFPKGSILPLPCNVERVAVGYLFRDEKGVFHPINEFVNVKGTSKNST